MERETREIPRELLRTGAVASIAAGVLLIAGFALHPAGEDATFGTDPRWVPAHAMLWIAFTVALVGWVAVYVEQAAEAGRLGVVAIVVLLLGTSLASWIFSSDVTFVPAIAADAPALFRRIYDTRHIVIGLASVLAWVLGSVLLGISIVRAKVFPQGAGILLVIGTVIVPIAYATGLSVRIVGVGGDLAGIAQIWLGYALLRTRHSRSAGPA
ncbi:MAG TPA: hypothetical protein VFK13_05105 [Gemmatimonadaceae bacterium]|nr:hypothetical protein [Gemmatimonadaceae bacterium]